METTQGAPRRRGKAKGLTDTAARNAKPKSKPYKLTDSGGLFLLVTPNGTKLWRLRFWLQEKEGVMALGRYPEISLADARQKREGARKLIATGRNPVHEAQQAKRDLIEAQQRGKEVEFGTLCTAWLELTDKDLRPTTIQQRRREITKYLLPVFGSRPLPDITRVELSELLKRVGKTAPEVARNLRAHLNGIFDFSVDSGFAKGNPTPTKKIFAKRQSQNHPALSISRVGDFLLALARAKSCEIKTRAAMRLMILTGVRKSEASGARCSEFDIEAGIWTIPPQRMKKAKEHIVPLSTQAKELIASAVQNHGSKNNFIFPNSRNPRKPMAANSLNAIMRRLGFSEGATVHGWRAIFSTWANERGENPDVIEACLAHASGDAVRRAYNRALYLEQRRELLQKWADWLEGQQQEAESRLEQGLLA